MFILRLILIVILVVCLGWSTIFFAGPYIIKWAIFSHSGGQIIPSNVTMTPKLDAKIGKLDFQFEVPQQDNIVNGFSRSAQIFWSLSKKRPLLEISIGPTYIEKVFFAESLKFVTPSLSQFDFQKIFIKAEFENMQFEHFGKSAAVQFQAYFTDNLSRISDFHFDLSDVNTVWLMPWSAPNIEGSINFFDLKLPLNKQEIPVEFSINSLGSDNPKIIVSKANGTIIINEMNAKYKAGLANLDLANLDGSIEKINIQGLYNFEYLTHDTLIDFFNGAFSNVPSFPFLNMQINTINQNYRFEASGELNSFDLNVSDNYIGKLPASSLEIEGRVDTEKAKTNVIANLATLTHNPLNFFGDIRFEGQLGGKRSFWGCFEAECEFNNMNLDYKLGFGQEWLRGVLGCLSPPCNFSSLSHTLTTSDTGAIFTSITDSNILNPLMTIFFYNFIKAGKEIDKGHEIKIN